MHLAWSQQRHLSSTDIFLHIKVLTCRGSVTINAIFQALTAAQKSKYVDLEALND
jgi:hypothetical protein